MNDNKKDRLIIGVLGEEQINQAAKTLSNYTALIESCDWDEEKAEELFAKALDAFINIYEYSQYDEKVITSNKKFLEILKTNLTDITEVQFEAVVDLIDCEIKKRAQLIKNKEEIN